MRGLLLSVAFSMVAMVGCATESASATATEGPAEVAVDEGIGERSIGSSSGGGTDYCATASPDMTVAFGSNTTYLGSTSPDASYATRAGCKRYIVDFNVYSSASIVPGGYYPDFAFDAEQGEGPAAFVLTPNDCATLHLSMELYVKHYGETSFTHIATRTGQGAMYGKFCILTSTQNGPYSFLPPSSNYDTYRVAATHQVLGTYKRVKDSIHHLQ